MASVKKAASSFAKEIRRSATKFGKIFDTYLKFQRLDENFQRF